MLKVMLTIDAEIWPKDADWPRRAVAPDKTDFADELAADIYGNMADGEYGLPYQMAVLNRHGLKAVYFVEALFASRIGVPVLKDIIDTIRAGGHEVQLHLHTEWLGDIHDPLLPHGHRQYLSQFTREQQRALIRKGLDNLAAAGAGKIDAFRAGSFGANRDTLLALADNGIAIDSSYNRTCLQDDWGLVRPPVQPVRLDGVWEFPMAAFCDYPGHFRHAQLCACSFAELRHALLAGAQAGWYSFVILMHSFELLKNRHGRNELKRDHLVMRRFEKLCAFLASRPDLFCTTVFSEIDLATIPPVDQDIDKTIIRSRPLDTAWRYVEQGFSRFT
jgi:peptidoglycan/xylan/chitin deacetylase (PgdA/CDA1 family)